MAASTAIGVISGLYRGFHRSCLCPVASAGVCVLSANQGSPRQEAVYGVRSPTVRKRTLSAFFEQINMHIAYVHIDEFWTYSLSTLGAEPQCRLMEMEFEKMM